MNVTTTEFNSISFTLTPLLWPTARRPKFLICIRVEPHLTPEFSSLTLEGMATHLSLDDGYEQDADIERYLMDSFHKIARTHGSLKIPTLLADFLFFLKGSVSVHCLYSISLTRFTVYPRIRRISISIIVTSTTESWAKGLQISLWISDPLSVWSS